MSSVRLSGNAGGTGVFTIESPSSNNNRTVTLPDSAGTAVVASAAVTVVGQIPFSTDGSTYTPTAKIVADTAKSATSTSVDFTGIPSWVKRITVMFNGVSTNGTSNWLLQLGDAGGIENTGYTAYSSIIGTVSVASGANYTAGFGLSIASASAIANGHIIICNLTGNTWTAGGMLARSDTANGIPLCGAKTLSDTLTQIRITTVNGTDAFDAGTINILYE